jgi:predicted aspartyl protease
MVAMGLLLRVPANAQETQKYDPILEKRSDLRLQFWHNQNAAANTVSNAASSPQTAPRSEYSGMVDFVTLAAKHSDMRLRAAQIGYANACAEWQEQNRPKSANKTTVTVSPGVAVPFTFDPLLQPRIVVQLRINGHEAMPFLVDTGLNAGLLIDTQAARQLHLPVDENAPAIPLGKIDARRVHLDSVSYVGSANASLAASGFSRTLVGDLTVFRASQGREALAGIIGIDMLSRNAVRFDFASHVMTLLPAGHATLPGGTGSVLPLQQHKGDACFFVQTTLQQGVETEWLLDTGSEGTAVPMSVAQRLHAAACKSSGSGTAYGLSIMPDLLLPSLRLGDCALDQVAIDSLPQTPFGYPMGLNLLARFRVTMDFPNRRMLLEHPTENTSTASLPGYTGIHLASQDSRLIAAGIDAGSPAQQAGVQIGDVVTQIDGKSANGLPFVTARRLLEGFAGTVATIKIQRTSGGPIQATFTRPSEFARPGLPVDGLFLNIPAHKPMEVVGLLPHCAGEEGGLRPGDVILDFNGQPTSEITPAVLAVEFRKPLLTLKVQRQGCQKPLEILLTAPQSDPDTAHATTSLGR